MHISDTARHTLLILHHTSGWVDPHLAGLPVQALAELSRRGLVEVVVPSEDRARLQVRITPGGRQQVAAMPPKALAS